MQQSGGEVAYNKTARYPSVSPIAPAWESARERARKIGDKKRLTELNHVSYNNLTFESDRKTLRHDSYRRGRLGIQEMPMYNGFRGSRWGSIGTQRTFRCFSTGANYTTKAANAASDTSYSQSSLVGGRKGQARQNPAPQRPVKGK